MQHVLGTLDPRIPGLGAWQPVDMSNDGGAQVIIDLSGSSFGGEPGPEYASLSDAELTELLDAMAEADAELEALPGELSDGELAALMRAAEQQEGTMSYDDPFTEFNDAFTASYAAQQARQDAISAAIAEDTLRPARRDEDRLARAVRRAADGVYDSPPAVTMAAESAAIELAVATGRGMCGTPDEFGRCSARFHDLECAHGAGTDWLASGPPRATYENALANWAGGLNLAGTPMAVWDDPDAPDAAAVIPSSTVELAHELASDLGLFDDAPFTGGGGTGLDDVSLLCGPAMPVTAYDAMAQDMGYGGPPPGRLIPPGISELAAQLGLT